MPSPKLIIIGLLGLGFMALMGGVLKAYNQGKADDKARIQAVIDSTQLAQKEASRADGFESALNSTKATLKQRDKALAESLVAQKKINVEFTAFRVRAASEEAVLDNPKFSKVFTGKSSLFIKRANEATAKQFKEIAEILDGN